MSARNQVIEQNEDTYPLLIGYLPDEYRHKAEMELNETPYSSDYFLQELKLMAKSNIITKDIDFHEDFLRQFLRQSKHDVPRALKRLQAFVKFRRNNAPFFKNLDLIAVSKTPDYRYCTTLPWRCKDGCTIVLFEMSKWDPSGITVNDLMRLGLMMYHQSLRNPVTQINGFKMIVDWKGSRLRQLKYMTPQVMYASYQAFMDCTPARNKEFHMLNESIIMRTIYAILKPFLSEKIRSRIVFHSSPKSLLKYFPKHALPGLYGGDLDNYYMEDWIKEANEQQRLATINGQCNYCY